MKISTKVTSTSKLKTIREEVCTPLNSSMISSFTGSRSKRNDRFREDMIMQASRNSFELSIKTD